MKSSKILSLGLSLCLASVMFTGCSEDEDAALSAAPAAVAGTWVHSCYMESDNSGNLTESRSEVVVVADGKVTITENSYYGDNTCASLDDVKVITYSMVYGDARTLAGSGETVYNMDGTNGALSITPMSSTTAADLNTDAMCGLTDWAVNATKDVTTCLQALGELGDFYDILAVLPSDSKLYTGDSSGLYDASTEALRPVALDSEGSTKQ